jgi:hypothetical protein
MKRKKKDDSYPRVKAIKPLFWKKCKFCNNEFRLESGYMIEDVLYRVPSIGIAYCCNECAKTVQEVKNLVKDYNLKLPPILIEPLISQGGCSDDGNGK